MVQSIVIVQAGGEPVGVVPKDEQTAQLAEVFVSHFNLWSGLFFPLWALTRESLAQPLRGKIVKTVYAASSLVETQPQQAWLSPSLPPATATSP